MMAESPSRARSRTLEPRFATAIGPFEADPCELRISGAGMGLFRISRPRPVDAATIALGLRGRTREEIIDELLEVLVRAGKLSDAAAARDALLGRERLAGTGSRDGIALPHGKTDSARGLAVALGVSVEGVDFGSSDGKPCKIFALCVAPPGMAGEQLGLLAEIRSRLADPLRREAALEAGSPEELLAILSRLPVRLPR